MVASTVKDKEFTLKYSPSLAEQITDFLMNAIIEGEFIGGERLIESQLQRKFGVSRAPIRESFRILENSGLLINIPRKGRIVRRIKKKDVEENFMVRAVLESLAARLAVSYLKPEDIEKMKVIVSKMNESTKSGDLESYFKYHFEFHDVFVKASQNDTLIGILDNLRRQSYWFRFIHIRHSDLKPYKYAFSVHRDILDLFIKRDGAQVEALVKEHILIGLKDTLKVLESRTESKTDG